MRMIKTGSAIAAAAFILSGCVISGPAVPTTPNVPAAPTFAEGSWAQGSVAQYRFGSGRFVGTANDTGNQVATGTYRYVNRNTIQISSFSTVQQKTIVANCLLVAGGGSLNCTNDSGLNFSLNRA